MSEQIDLPKIWERLGSLTQSAEQGQREREKLFEMLEGIRRDVSAIAHVNIAIAATDQKAKSAHDRLDKLTAHFDNIKMKALGVLFVAALSAAGASHMIEPMFKVFFK